MYGGHRQGHLRSFSSPSTFTAISTQRDVLSVIKTLPGCSEAALEQRTQDGLLGIDIAITLPSGEKLAFEVDGPTHFLHPLPSSEGRPSLLYNGNTLLRNRLLEARGWRLISIPAVEWDRLKAREARADYLKGLIMRR